MVLSLLPLLLVHFQHLTQSNTLPTQLTVWTPTTEPQWDLSASQLALLAFPLFIPLLPFTVHLPHPIFSLLIPCCSADAISREAQSNINEQLKVIQKAKEQAWVIPKYEWFFVQVYTIGILSLFLVPFFSPPALHCLVSIRLSVRWRGNSYEVLTLSTQT